MKPAHATQTQFAKAELEKAGRPMPMDWNGDHLALPELDVEPHPYLYRELATVQSKISALEQGHGIHGAVVKGEKRYYTRRNLRSAK